MDDAINIKINLVRHFLRVRDYRRALDLLKEAQRLAEQQPDYPYWDDLNELLRSTEEALRSAPPREHDLSDGGDEWPSHS